MVRGYEKNQERLQALSALGRQLARRSESKCELCGTAGVRLDPWEVPPRPDDPDVDQTIFACKPCRKGLEDDRVRDPERWRFLETVVWSDLPAVQVLAVRMMRRIAEDPKHFWAREILENLYLEPEIEEWIERA